MVVNGALLKVREIVFITGSVQKDAAAVQRHQKYCFCVFTTQTRHLLIKTCCQLFLVVDVHHIDDKATISASIKALW